jgi:hypothetical protein
VLSWQDLSPAELRLCQSVSSGSLVDCADGRPPEDAVVGDPDREVRAELICRIAKGRWPTRLGEPRMIRLAGAVVVGDLDLESARLVVPIAFDRCLLGQVDLDQAEAPGIVLTNCSIESLTAYQLETGNLLLNGTTCASAVRLAGAHLTGVLNLTATRLRGSDGVAFDGHNLDIGGDVCGNGLRADGEVRLTGAHVRGSVDLADAVLRHPDGSPLNASSLTVDQDMHLSGDFVARGEVRLQGASIRGELDLCGANLAGGDAVGHKALSADLLAVGQDMVCTPAAPGGPPFTVSGQMRLPGAHVEGRLDLRNARLANDLGPALVAEGLVVGEDVLASGRFTAAGLVNLANARVAESLDLAGARLTGPLDLSRASVHHLVDTDTTWPEEVVLNDFDYGSLSAMAEPGSVRERLAWLDRNARGYTPQIYSHLARTYRADGQDDAAREVLIAKLRRRSAARRSGRPRLLRAAEAASDRFLDWTIGYGYRPLRIVWWLLGLLVVGSVLFQSLRMGGLVVPSPGTGPEATFYAPLYVLDLLLPVAGLRLRDDFVAIGPALWFGTAFTLTGWLLGIVLLAGLTGVFKRD